MKLQKSVSGFILTLLLLFIIQTADSQTNLLLKMKLQSDKSISVSTISKIIFDQGNMIIGTKNQTNEAIALQDISKIMFDMNSSVDNLTVKPEQLEVYPNPVKSFLYIKGVEDELVSVFRLDGVMVMHFRYSNYANGIDINALTKGLYLIKTTSRTAKFVKL